MSAISVHNLLWKVRGCFRSTIPDSPFLSYLPAVLHIMPPPPPPPDLPAPEALCKKGFLAALGMEVRVVGKHPSRLYAWDDVRREWGSDGRREWLEHREARGVI